MTLDCSLSVFLRNYRDIKILTPKKIPQPLWSTLVYHAIYTTSICYTFYYRISLQHVDRLVGAYSAPPPPLSQNILQPYTLCTISTKFPDKKLVWGGGVKENGIQSVGLNPETPLCCTRVVMGGI